MLAEKTTFAGNDWVPHLFIVVLIISLGIGILVCCGSFTFFLYNSEISLILFGCLSITRKKNKTKQQQQKKKYITTTMCHWTPNVIVIFFFWAACVSDWITFPLCIHQAYNSPSHFYHAHEHTSTFQTWQLAGCLTHEPGFEASF